MKTPNMRHTLSAALTGLMLAAMTHVSYAVPEAASDTQIAGLTDTVGFTPTTTIAEPRRAGRGSPLTLYVEDASGNAFRLVHVQGRGWKYAEGWKSPDRIGGWLFHKTAWPMARPPTAKAVVPDDEPLTVFIDGPSGFTYVWNRDEGWKFVGKIADRSP